MGDDEFLQSISAQPASAPPVAGTMGDEAFLQAISAPAPVAPQANAPAAMPTMPEPVMQGYNTDPTVPAPADQGLTIQGYISNTMNDIGQISGGIGAAGSAVAGRMDDWLNPHALWDKNKSVQDKFMAAQQYMPTVLSGQKNKDLDMRGLFQHDTDGINAAKLGVGVAKQYYDTYGKPITEATDTKSLQPLMKLAKLPYERPISTALDMLPFVGPVAKAINPKVISAFKFVDEAATKATPFYSQLKSDVQAAQALGAATSKWNNKYINEIADNLAAVEQAYNFIPKALRDQVISAGEMRDPALYAQLSRNADVVEFWKLANQTDGKLVGELIKAGALTREEYLVAKYGPYTRAVNGIDEAALWTPDGQKMLAQAKRDLDKQGIQPTYMGLMTANQVRGALKLKGGLFGKVPQRNTYLAEDLATADPTGLPQPKGVVPDFLKKREAGNRIADKHHNDALDVHTARYVQGLQLLRLKDFFADIISNPTIIKDGVNFDLHEFMKDLMKQTGTRPEVATEFLKDLPKHINLPSAAYTRLMQLTGNSKTLINRAYFPLRAELATLSKNLMLGLDFAWAVNQSAQNVMIGGVSMFRGVNDIPASLMALAVLGEKDVRAALPKSWGANFSELPQTSSALRGAVWQEKADELAKFGINVDQALVKDVAKVMAPVQMWMETVFGVAQAGDAAARAVHGAYQMLRTIETTTPAVQTALKDAFNLMAAKQKVLEGLADAKAVEEAGKHIDDWFGKYDALTAQDWKTMRSIAPFWLWWMHSATIAKRLATDTPIKLSLMAHTNKQIPLEFQTNDMPESTKKMGSLPMYDYNGNRRVSQNGYPLMMNKPGFTPFGQVPELVLQTLHATNAGPGNEGLPMLAPDIWMGIALFSGKNPSNGRPWQDPHNYKVRGAQYNEKGEEVTSTPLPMQNLVARGLFPRQEGFLREVLAAPYQPSDYTTIGDGAYKLDSSTQEPLKNFGLGQSLFHMASKLKPMEQRFDANQEATINNMKKKNFLKAQARQQGVTQNDPMMPDVGKLLASAAGEIASTATNNVGPMLTKHQADLQKEIKRKLRSGEMRISTR